MPYTLTGCLQYVRPCLFLHPYIQSTSQLGSSPTLIWHCRVPPFTQSTALPLSLFTERRDTRPHDHGQIENITYVLIFQILITVLMRSSYEINSPIVLSINLPLRMGKDSHYPFHFGDLND
jgi:hypothetical protein